VSVRGGDTSRPRPTQRRGARRAPQEAAHPMITEKLPLRDTNGHVIRRYDEAEVHRFDGMEPWVSAPWPPAPSATEPTIPSHGKGGRGAGPLPLPEWHHHQDHTQRPVRKAHRHRHSAAPERSSSPTSNGSSETASAWGGEIASPAAGLLRAAFTRGAGQPLPVQCPPALAQALEDTAASMLLDVEGRIHPGQRLLNCIYRCRVWVTGGEADPPRRDHVQELGT
jgi:hypothetical protein